MTDQSLEILAPQPLPRSRASQIFFGVEGLRAGWGILIFIILFVTISFAAQFTLARLQHKPFGRDAQHAAQEKAIAEANSNTPPAPKASSPRSVIIGEGSGFLVVLLATFLTARIERRPLRSFGLGGRHRLPQFLQGLLWGVACLSVLVALLRLSGLLNFDALLLHGASAVRYALLWTIGFTFVAFLEETLLRGYLQVTLARGLTSIVEAVSDTPHRHTVGFWTAALILSFLFGLGHGGNPGESPIGLLSAGLAGLVFCLALYRTGSLWWAIGFHASWDWAQSFLYGVADSGTTIQNHLYATHPTGTPLLSGGLTGPEGSLYVLPILAVVAAIIFLTLPRPTSLTPAATPPPHTGSPASPVHAASSAAYRR